MSNLQKYFDQFHEAIKLDTENSELRTSREAIKNKLGASLKQYFENKKITVPSFFDQGSYAMDTGVKPAGSEGNYDIDEGVKFDINTSDFPDPVEVKNSVKDALSGHTELGVCIKGPCVRVIYSEDKEEKYHVDLAIYATNGQSTRGSVIHLGRGKEFSSDENRFWEEAQPELLIDLITNKFVDKNHQAQFRRIIRYLKRWKDIKFSSIGHSAPRGIALTVLANQYFYPFFDVDGAPRDIDALVHLVGKIKDSAQLTANDGEYIERIICNLPVRPNNDLFGLMTNNQMKIFIEKINALYAKLAEAKNEELNDGACNILAQVFGDDFPFPEVNKIFKGTEKPHLGYQSTIERAPGEDLVPATIEVDGAILMANGDQLPIVSNGKVLLAGQRLSFHANYDLKYREELKWRVVNTGKHVLSIHKEKGINAFRGILHRAKTLMVQRGNYVNSYDPLTTHEHTEYTGKHWIECTVLKNQTCIAKSKPFYVNIYNPAFPNYD